MNSRERVLRALNHQSVDRAPRDLWASPAIAAEQGDALAEIAARYPSDLQFLNCRWPPGKRSHGAPDKSGAFTDAWQCGWQLNRDGTHSVTHSPLENAAAAAAFQLPCELHDRARLVEINAKCDASSRFTLVWCDAGPLARLHELRGHDATTELNAKDKNVRTLLERVHEFHRQEVRLWCTTHVDAVALADELIPTDSSHGAIKSWRSTFKPLLRDYCNIAHDQDKFLFLYCTRACDELLADLVEIGVDAVHLPWTGDPGRISDSVRRRITFWGGQADLSCGLRNAQRSIHEAVMKVRRAFDYRAGGVISHCYWQPGVPLQNVATFFENWMIPLPVPV